MAQKLISRINQRAHYSKNEDRPEVAELIKLIIKCMDEKEEFYLEEVKGLTRALLMQIARWNEKDETQEKNAILDDASIALILPALNYIGENFHESIRIEELADASGNLTLMQSGEKSNSKYVWSVNMFLVSCSSDIV